MSSPSFFFVPSQSFQWWPLCVAVAAVVSKAVAENEGGSARARVRAILSFVSRTVALLGVIGGGVSYLAADAIPTLFISDPAFLGAAAESLRTMAPLLAVSSVMDVSDAALIAADDGVFNFASTAVATAVGAARLLVVAPRSIADIWLALLASYAIRLALNGVRFAQLFLRERAPAR